MNYYEHGAFKRVPSPQWQLKVRQHGSKMSGTLCLKPMDNRHANRACVFVRKFV